MLADGSRPSNSINMMDQRRKTWLLVREQLLVLAFFVVATVIAGRKALPQLDSVLLGDDIDVYINPWADWWTKKALTDPDQQLWESDYLFYPQGAELYYHSFSHLNTALTLALDSAMDYLRAYNITILINYVLAGFTMYQLMRYLSGSLVAALLAGIVFAFNSHNIYQSAHPVLVSVWILPLYTLAVIRGFREQHLIWPVLASLMLFLGAAASTLILVVLGIWSGPLVLYLLLAKPVQRPSKRNAAVFLILSALFLFPLLLPLLKEALQGSNTSFVKDSTQSFPADMIAPIVPPWLVWVRRGLYIGIVPAYLCIVALGRKRRSAGLWLLLLLGAYLFSIGPNPTFAGRALQIELPWSHAVALLLHPYRLNILASFGLAATVAYGWCAVSEMVSRKRLVPLFASVAVLLLLADYLAMPIPVSHADIPQFYAHCLAARPEDLKLAIIPSGRQIDKVHMYYQTAHGMRMTGGTISRHTSVEFAYLEANALLRAGRMENWPASPPADGLVDLRDLADNGIDLLILEKVYLDLDPWLAAVPLEPAYEDDTVLAYDVGQLAGKEWLSGELCPGQG